MKGLVYHGNELLKWEDVPDVEPKSNEVKICVKAAGICGSDVHGYQGITGRRIPPMIMGHEFSGVVTQIGAGVKNVLIGDRVAPYPVDYCGNCPFCEEGNMQFCPNRRQFGVLTVDGAFAEYICVPERVCYKLADNISFTVGSTVEPLAVACRGLKQAGSLEGKTELSSEPAL
jgi:threonine dehydrogenase-like Zn-dependent dehydrogenase